MGSEMCIRDSQRPLTSKRDNFRELYDTKALKHSTQILLLHTADAETGKKTPPLTALGKEAGFQVDWVICLRRPSSVFGVH